jgi:hypothetical protein
VFSYDAEVASSSRRIGGVHIDFSSYSDVYWRWSSKRDEWLRSHGPLAHTLTDGNQVSATNVVAMKVKVGVGSIVDAAGNPSPEVNVTGKGRAYVFRDGRVIVGRWERPTLADVTRFVTRSGHEIALAPGTTWVELVPSSIDVGTVRNHS